MEGFPRHSETSEKRVSAEAGSALCNHQFLRRLRRTRSLCPPVFAKVPYLSDNSLPYMGHNGFTWGLTLVEEIARRIRPPTVWVVALPAD